MANTIVDFDVLPPAALLHGTLASPASLVHGDAKASNAAPPETMDYTISTCMDLLRATPAPAQSDYGSEGRV